MIKFTKDLESLLKLKMIKINENMCDQSNKKLLEILKQKNKKNIYYNKSYFGYLDYNIIINKHDFNIKYFDRKKYDETTRNKTKLKNKIKKTTYNIKKTKKQIVINEKTKDKQNEIKNKNILMGLINKKQQLKQRF